MTLELTREQAQRMKCFGISGNWGSRCHPESHSPSKCVSVERRNVVKDLIKQGVLYADIQKELHISSETIVKIKNGVYDD